MDRGELLHVLRCCKSVFFSVRLLLISAGLLVLSIFYCKQGINRLVVLV